MACRQLGFSPTGWFHVTLLINVVLPLPKNFFLTGATAFVRASFGPGTGPILLDNVGCSGSETRLVDCINDGIGVHNCGHSEDAGVRCQRKQFACHSIVLSCQKTFSY